MSSSVMCYWVKTYASTPNPTLPPNKKLIGFGSFEKVNLKLAGGGGVRTPGPPGQLRPCPTELSKGRMDPRVGSGHDFAGFWLVESGQHFSVPAVLSPSVDPYLMRGLTNTVYYHTTTISDLFSFLLIISWYLNRYEFSNTTFGLIDFLRYLIYNN